MKKKRILLIEPYYGGSHRQFLKGLISYLPAEFVLLSLPARKWKMRMQISAPWFVQKISEMRLPERYFDSVLFSTYLDGAVFRALVAQLPGWNTNCKYLCYFHENQFCYPGCLPQTTIHQFTAINFNTALCADGLAFNSAFNRSSFLCHCRKYLGKTVDMDLKEQLEAIEKKSVILYPGLDFSLIDEQAGGRVRGADPPLIIWNHRWEYDKNPEQFLSILCQLKDEDVPFRCAILGQNAEKNPACFEQARKKISENCIQFGYVADEEKYARILCSGDIVVSTALHEFFGYAVLEAVRAGCYPLLPNRLSYPELFPREFLYEDGELLYRLKQLISERRTLAESNVFTLTSRFFWPAQRERYQNWLDL